ncbi:MAG: TIGR04141 family sporadically distributed protein [Acidimicrobiaceae bacterium]|nr:TIGR04141 family sporadically distributed protein [Acidimicrobiaceae bacterium]
MPEPKRHLSLYLMKNGTSVDEAIRDPSKVSRHDLVNVDSEGALFVKTSHGQVPWWIEFLDPLSSDDLKAPESRTTSAVLSLSFVTANGDYRTVCYTFGHGRHLLDQDRIDRSFGLRVALNTIDPAKLRGLDTRRQEDIVVNSRSQSSIGTDIASFNLNEYRDILTKAAGSTTGDHTEALGGSIHGADGISFDVPIQVDELANRAHHLLSLYQLERYKEIFPFVDYILPVDPEESDKLDGILAAALRAILAHGSTDFRCLYLASPELLDLEETEGYMFSSERGKDKTVHTELSLVDYINTRRNLADSYTINTAKRDDVLLRNRDQTDRRLSSVYRCLIVEIERANATYQLIDGRWYEVEGSFVEQINLEVSSILSATVAFSLHFMGETEESYNSRVAHELDALLRLSAF